MKILAVLVLVAGCGTDYKLPGGDSADQLTGKVLYVDTCAQCHGENGEGNDLGPQVLNPVRDYATYVTRNSRGIEMTEMGYVDEMPAHGTDLMTDAELGLVMDFLAEAPKPTDGEGLYTRFCGNCHGANGWGGRVEQDVQHEADEALETVRDGEGDSKFWDRTEYMPEWNAQQLTDDEVAKIEAYLSTLPANPNGEEEDDEDEDSDEDVDEGED
jgi:mono/diheme cytochrome c family protein